MTVASPRLRRTSTLRRSVFGLFVEKSSATTRSSSPRSKVDSERRSRRQHRIKITTVTNKRVRGYPPRESDRQVPVAGGRCERQADRELPRLFGRRVDRIPESALGRTRPSTFTAPRTKAFGTFSGVHCPRRNRVSVLLVRLTRSADFRFSVLLVESTIRAENSFGTFS